MPSQTAAGTLINLWILDAPWAYPTWSRYQVSQLGSIGSTANNRLESSPLARVSFQAFGEHDLLFLLLQILVFQMINIMEDFMKYMDWSLRLDG